MSAFLLSMDIIREASMSGIAIPEKTTVVVRGPRGAWLQLSDEHASTALSYATGDFRVQNQSSVDDGRATVFAYFEDGENHADLAQASVVAAVSVYTGLIRGAAFTTRVDVIDPARQRLIDSVGELALADARIGGWDIARCYAYLSTRDQATEDRLRIAEDISPPLFSESMARGLAQSKPGMLGAVSSYLVLGETITPEIERQLVSEVGVQHSTGSAFRFDPAEYDMLAPARVAPGEPPRANLYGIVLAANMSAKFVDFAVANSREGWDEQISDSLGWLLERAVSVNKEFAAEMSRLMVIGRLPVTDSGPTLSDIGEDSVDLIAMLKVTARLAADQDFEKHVQSMAHEALSMVKPLLPEGVEINRAGPRGSFEAEVLVSHKQVLQAAADVYKQRLAEWPSSPEKAMPVTMQAVERCVHTALDSVGGHLFANRDAQVDGYARGFEPLPNMTLMAELSTAYLRALQNGDKGPVDPAKLAQRVGAIRGPGSISLAPYAADMTESIDAVVDRINVQAAYDYVGKALRRGGEHVAVAQPVYQALLLCPALKASGCSLDRLYCRDHFDGIAASLPVESIKAIPSDLSLSVVSSIGGLSDARFAKHAPLSEETVMAMVSDAAIAPDVLVELAKRFPEVVAVEMQSITINHEPETLRLLAELANEHVESALYSRIESALYFQALHGSERSMLGPVLLHLATHSNNPETLSSMTSKDGNSFLLIDSPESLVALHARHQRGDKGVEDVSRMLRVACVMSSNRVAAFDALLGKSPQAFDGLLFQAQKVIEEGAIYSHDPGFAEYLLEGIIRFSDLSPAGRKEIHITGGDAVEKALNMVSASPDGRELACAAIEALCRDVMLRRASPLDGITVGEVANLLYNQSMPFSQAALASLADKGGEVAWQAMAATGRGADLLLSTAVAENDQRKLNVLAAYARDQEMLEILSGVSESAAEVVAARAAGRDVQADHVLSMFTNSVEPEIAGREVASKATSGPGF